VSAVSAEIVDGTLPEKRLPPRALCRNMLHRTPESAGRSHGGCGAYRATSLVSAEMLARIGPVKLLLFKYLISHNQACSRTERRAHALAQRGRRRMDRHSGTHICVSAVSAEIVDGTLPEKRFSPRCLRHNVPVRTRESAGRSTSGGGAYRWASLVSAVMLARIGPVKPSSVNNLIMHSEACGRTERAARVQPRACAASPYRQRARPRVGAYRNVSAVSAEIVDGTVPTRPG
jgi:hypothetical protein